MHAPHLLDIEFTQVMRRFEQSGSVSSARAVEALEDLGSLRLIRHGHSPLLERVWAVRHNLTAYDALYVALAEALGAPLVTTDRRLAAAPGHGARVIVAGGE